MEGGINPYVYVVGNPVNNFDFYGLQTTLDLCANPKNAEACEAAGVIPKQPPKFPENLLPNKKPIEQVCKGDQPLSSLSSDVRKEAADYYQSVADSVNLDKKYGDAAQRLNQARADYLRGLTTKAPGQSGNFK